MGNTRFAVSSMERQRWTRLCRDKEDREMTVDRPLRMATFKGQHQERKLERKRKRMAQKKGNR